MDQSFSPDQTQVHIQVCFNELDDTELVDFIDPRGFTEQNWKDLLPATKDKTVIYSKIDESNNQTAEKGVGEKGFIDPIVVTRN